jgi:cytochrome b561
MTAKTTKGAFPILTRILHALIAVLMIGLIGLGWWMSRLSFYSSWYYFAPFLHKSLGVTVFFLGVLLVFQKFKNRPSPMQNHTALEKVASKIAHIVLFASLFTIPISGYIFTTYTGVGVVVFNLFEIPAVLPVSEQARDWAIGFHIYASYGLLAVIGAHGAGALKHHFWDQDRTLRRMTW